MLKGLRLSILMMAMLGLLFTACGDDDDDEDPAFTCATPCADYQECTAQDTCTLKDGMCAANTDCTDATKTECNMTSHMCEAAGTTTCTENDVKCVGTVINTCDAAGAWAAGDDCANNTEGKTECKAGACVAPDVTGDVKTIDEVKAMTEGVVSIEGVTVSYQEISTAGNVKGYYVEKGGKGIHVRIDSAVAPTDLPVAGDVVTVIATVDHFNGRSQVLINTKEGEELGSITKTSAGTIPAAVTGVLPLADPQESILVKLEGSFTITELGSKDNSYNTKLSYDTDKELVMRRLSLIHI